MRRICVALLLLSLWPMSGLSNDAEEAGAHMSGVEQEEEVQSANPGKELDYYRSRLDSAERYQDELLGAMEWVVGTSFSIVLTVIAVVVGLGWYTNFRLYRGDLEQIRQEQERKYEAHVEALKASMAEEMNGRVAEGIKEAKIEVKKASDNAVKGALNDIRELQLKMMHMEAKDWESKSIDANALYTLALAMPTALKVGGQIEVDQIAEEMERILGKRTDYMDATLAQNLIDPLKAIETEYPIVFESLVSQIKRAAGI